VETDCTGDFSWEKAIEKTILRGLDSSEFSHRLDPMQTWPAGSPSANYHRNVC
jgi:hypothetical protein